MVIKISILLTLLSPLIIKAECLSDISTQESGSSFQNLIQEITNMVSQKMRMDASENLQTMQNATSENIEMMVSAMSEQSASVDANLLKLINSMGSMINATTMNIDGIMSFVRQQSSNTDSNLVDVIDVVETVSGETKLWRDSLAEVMTSMHNHTMSLMVDIDRNIAQRLANAPRIEVNNPGIDLLREALVESNNILSGIKIEVLHKPSGFIEYNGHILLLPAALGGSELSWKSSLQRCLNQGAVPFIPRTVDDFKYIQKVSTIVTHISGHGVWLPASDLKKEGFIKWYDGSDASFTLRSFDWMSDDGYAGDNSEDHDCVNTWSNHFKLEFESCTRTDIWPMICELL